MAISATYLVLETIPEGLTIHDFRDHNYTSLKILTPSDLETKLRQVNARDWIRALADIDSNILKCQSKKQLYDKLEKIAESADFAADCTLYKKEVQINCAVRDNTYQIMKLLED